MRGQVLDFDFRTGTGAIAGDDGQRYNFAGTEWRPQSQPRAGQKVDFEIDATSARSVYTLGTQGTLVSSSGETNRLVAGLLALFLGIIGIHKFYMGYNRAGLTMLLVAVCGAILLFLPTIVMGVIAFCEAVTYLMMTDEEWQQKYVGQERPWF